MTHKELNHAVRDAVARAAAVVGLAGVALIHLIDLPDKLEETPYVGWMYIGAIVGSLILAGALIVSTHRRVWVATGALAAGVMAGYVLSRTTGLPSASGDIGNWGEPLGIASLLVEGCLVALSAGVLAMRRQAAAVRPSFPRPAAVARTGSI